MNFVNFYEKMVYLDFATDSWNRISTSFCNEASTHQGRWILQNWRDKGFKHFFNFLTKKLPDPSQDLKVEDHILLNKEVKLIDYSDSDKGMVKIMTADGSSYEAKHVIVTVPLGVFKAQHATMFKPQLPAVKVNSIEHLQFGALNKIMMEFEKPFWNESWDGFSMIWTQEGLSAIRETRLDW